MRTSSAASAEQLADELMRFFAQLMQTEQGDLFAVIAELDLTMPQVRGLFVLNAAEQGIPLTELAPRIGLSVAAAGRSVDGLVRKDLVSRTEDPVDRRVKRLALTGAGREATARVAGARREGFRRFAETLGERERTALAQGFATVFATWDEQERADG